MGKISLLFGGIGPPEIILIVILVLVLFGGRKIPELMRGMGQGIREFNRAKNSIEEEVKDRLRDEPQKIKEKSQ